MFNAGANNSGIANVATNASGATFTSGVGNSIDDFAGIADQGTSFGTGTLSATTRAARALAAQTARAGACPHGR